MSALAEEILRNFDKLSNPEQLEIAREILRRIVDLDFPALADEELALNAEELFLALDQEEASHE